MLTRAVKYEFGHFGPCNVGIFRKVVSKPYAIVQYTVSVFKTPPYNLGLVLIGDRT